LKNQSLKSAVRKQTVRENDYFYTRYGFLVAIQKYITKGGAENFRSFIFYRTLVKINIVFLKKLTFFVIDFKLKSPKTIYYIYEKNCAAITDIFLPQQKFCR
jgi:hypothetical protein